MVGETRPYENLGTGDRWVGAGLRDCWFLTEMVGETRPYENLGTRDRFCAWVGAGLLYCWFLR